ncbi:cyclin-like protein [Syncephalis fuscata]|nr:cyclin-like protein [Syncephalis fuscata]
MSLQDIVVGETPPQQRQLHEQHTQHQYWLFSPEELDLMRTKHNERAHQRILANWQQEWVSTALLEKQMSEDFALLNVAEELTLCNYFEQTVQLACRRFKFPDSVLATAVIYMKRFYLFNTVMDYLPNDIMLTCLYLASKTEGFFLSINDFVGKFKKVTAQSVTDMEMIVCESLKFHFTIHQPYRPLYGFFLDLQVSCRVMGGLSMDILRTTYDHAIKWVSTSLFTDVCLLYQPSQVALAAWRLAANETGLDITRYRYLTGLPSAIDQIDPLALEQLMATLDSITSILRNYTPITRQQVESIDRRLRDCRNPALNPLCAL